MISKFALIGNKVKIGKNVKIGSWTTIGSNTIIGDNTIIHSYVNISSGSYIGKNNQIFPFACIGINRFNKNQLKKNSHIKIGNNNIIKEHTILDSSNKNNETIIGNFCYIMPYCHISKNCKIGNRVNVGFGSNICNNNILENGVELGSKTVLNPFCRLGQDSYIHSNSIIYKDILPFIAFYKYQHNFLILNFINIRLYKKKYINLINIKHAYKVIYYHYNKPINFIISLIKLFCYNCYEIKKIIKFLKKSKKGLINN